MIMLKPPTDLFAKLLIFKYIFIVAKKKKSNRILIALECIETGMRTYVTQKNKVNSKEKLQIKKYNPKLRKHTLHKETTKLK